MAVVDPARVGERWLQAMRAGDWEAAWQQTDLLELPRRHAQAQGTLQREAHHLVWDGTPFDGRSVLVRCLHGLGDTLQFMRFVPELQRRASELHFLVQPHFLGLLQGGPGLGTVSNAWTDHPPAHEVEIEVMELAYALRATAATVPPPYPSLADLARARAALDVPRATGLNVGVLWSASDWDTQRSIDLGELDALFSLPGIRCFSLQQGPAADDPRIGAFGLLALSGKTASIESAAAAMLRMDVVLCVDGMPAHLAASLGRPTWVLLKHDADWRWGTGERTPWYPTMRLFRQRAPGDWRGPIEDARRALASLRTPPAAG